MQAEKREPTIALDLVRAEDALKSIWEGQISAIVATGDRGVQVPGIEGSSFVDLGAELNGEESKVRGRAAVSVAGMQQEIQAMGMLIEPSDRELREASAGQGHHPITATIGGEYAIRADRGVLAGEADIETGPPAELWFEWASPKSELLGHVSSQQEPAKARELCRDEVECALALEATALASPKPQILLNVREGLCSPRMSRAGRATSPPSGTTRSPTTSATGGSP